MFFVLLCYFFEQRSLVEKEIERRERGREKRKRKRGEKEEEMKERGREERKRKRGEKEEEERKRGEKEKEKYKEKRKRKKKRKKNRKRVALMVRKSYNNLPPTRCSSCKQEIAIYRRWR